MSYRISEDSLIRRAANQVCCGVGAESIILDLKSGIYYSLDKVAAKIWALIEQPTVIGAIRDAILSEYEVEPRVCARDVQAFIDALDLAGLIEVMGTVNEVAVI
jgi:coenzyme PQQ synthesis protein D (PqqD)